MSGGDSIERLLVQEEKTEETPPWIEDWLNDLEAERNALIIRLRSVEKPLVKYGRLKAETLSRRVR